MRGILTAMLAIFALAQGAFGATLGWDANTESNIAGYRLYYGTTSGNYSQVVDAGNTTQATISNLTAGATYYAAVTAYNTSSLESTKSAEVSFVASGTTPVKATPTVSLSSPANGMAYAAPATITVTASASESGGTISKVEFYNGSSLIATDTASPYTATFTGVPVGTYVLTARAYDAAGVTATSSTVTVTVGSTPVASKPTVALTSPISGSTFKAPATVTLSASASETGGTISKVEFYNGSTLLATDTASPYTVTFSGIPAATYTITARAYDTKGVSTTSAPVTVKVSP